MFEISPSRLSSRTSLPLPTLLLFALGGLVMAGLGCGSDSTEPETSACTNDSGTICTWAGTGMPAFDGGGKGLLESSFYWPTDMTFAPSGAVYILDWNNHVVRELVNDKLVTVIGTSDVGDGPFPGSGLDDFVPPGVPGTEIRLNHPTQMLPLPNGLVMLMSWHNHKMRTYDPATGLVLVVCGSEPDFGGDGGPAKDALLNQPPHAALDSQGNIFVLDMRNYRIRKIDASDIINTVAGTGEWGDGGDGGDPLQAKFAFFDSSAFGNPPPSGGMIFDDQDRLYISDSYSHRIRRIDFNTNVITTFAGTGVAGFSGDGGPAAAAQVNNPRDLEIEDGVLYFADELNHRVRAVDIATGTITTVAGNGTAGFSGDGGPAVDAMLNRPAGIDFDPQGRLYIVDTYNHRIRRVNL